MQMREKNTSMRLTPEDQQIIEALKAKTGIRFDSEVLRQGLRALAEKWKIETGSITQA